MVYSKSSSIVCFGDTKQAALYFERVLPISFFFDEFCCQSEILGKILKPIIELDLSQPKTIEKLYPEIYESITSYFNSEKANFFNKIIIELIGSSEGNPWRSFVTPVLHVLLSYLNIIGATWFYHKKEIQNALPAPIIEIFEQFEKYSISCFDENKLRKLLTKCMDLYSFFYAYDIIQTKDKDRSFRKDIDIISKNWSGKIGQILLPEISFLYKDATSDDISLELAKLNLIDTSQASWDQILEFRKDEESRNKLRNLRIFFHTNYSGKSSSFVEDDLKKRLDDYSNTCKDWGFETTTTVLSTIMDSKNLVSLLAGSTCAMLFGGYDIAAVTGATIEIGNIAITIAKQKHAFNKLKRDHYLAYIIEAKEKFDVTDP